MNTRTLDLYRSMRRIAAVILADPALRAAAEESNAFELFLKVIDDFEALQCEEPATRLELKQLAGRKTLLTEEVNRLIDSIRSTIALTPWALAPLPTLAPVSTDFPTYRFSQDALAIINVASTCASVLIANGLHPRTFDDARALIQRLTELDRDEIQTSIHSRTFETRLSLTVDASRKRRKQLQHQLRHAMTDETRRAWKAAGSLGRTHRPKQLSAGATPKLLAAPAGQTEPFADPAASDPPPSPAAPLDAAPIPEPAAPGGAIKQLARRVGLIAPRPHAPDPRGRTPSAST